MRKREPESESGSILLGGEEISFSISRSRKRKRTIAFKMERDASIHVLAPFSASLRAVTKVLEKRAPWLLREFANCKKISPQNDFTDGAVISYLGYKCVLRVTQGAGMSQSCRLSPHFLHVHVPDEKLSQENLRQEVRLEIMLWLKKRARTKFRKRLDLWASRLDVSYKKLIVTDPERRWGSCSVDNIIRLNWRLIMAPLPILDYVVAHELCHVRHKNHSARFWGFLAQAMPDFQTRRRQLRTMETALGL